MDRNTSGIIFSSLPVILRAHYYLVSTVYRNEEHSVHKQYISIHTEVRGVKLCGHTGTLKSSISNISITNSKSNYEIYQMSYPLQTTTMMMITARRAATQAPAAAAPITTEREKE